MNFVLGSLCAFRRFFFIIPDDLTFIEHQITIDIKVIKRQILNDFLRCDEQDSKPREPYVELIS